MDILEIIEKKDNKQELSKEEIEFFINGFVSGNIPDYQMSSLLKSIKLEGMSDKEIIYLTDVMLHSGDILNLPFNTVDKHSTGGVGDKTTIVLIPLLASIGIKSVKMSGRSLGHTGGTIDKLESIEGFQTSISLNDLQTQVEEIGAAIVSQMGNLCPADKVIYALRDVTDNVASIPLIASSIMSKKLASGADTIVIDLKVGNGALMQTIEDARELSKIMIKIGKNYNKKVICVLTNMHQPLGYAVGNALEIKESIDTLNGGGPEDLRKLVLTLGSIMVSSYKKISLKEGLREVNDALISKKGYDKFKQMVLYQHGNLDSIKISTNTIDIKSNKKGYISCIDTFKLGQLVRELGAGRETKEDIIDYSVGCVLSKKISDSVEVGDTLITIYYNERQISEEEVLSCFTISDKKQEKPKLIYEIIGDNL